MPHPPRHAERSPRAAPAAARRPLRADAAREELARRWRPRRIRLLLIAAATPEDPAHDFYSLDAGASADPLFAGVAHVLFETDRVGDRESALRALRRRGVFVTYASPSRDVRLADSVPWLPLRLDELAAGRIVLVGSELWDAAHASLVAAGAPLVDKRVPEPAPGHRVEFARELRTALVRAGLENLIRPLPGPE